MIDAVRDYLAPKRFGTVAYVCVIVHFLCGLVFTAVTAALRNIENGKFSCSVDVKSTATFKKQVDQACFTKYDQVYNSPIPLYGFVLLSIGLSVLVSVIYSLLVWKQVDEIESRYKRQTDGEADYRVHGPGRKIFYVFYRYFYHLVVRSLFGIIFTVVQHTYFYPNGFDLKFNCNLPRAEVTSNINTPKRNVSRNLNSTTPVNCENATASEKWLWGIIVSVINIIVAIIIFVEVIYLLPRLPVFKRRSGVGWNDDSEFVIEYLLGKQYNVLGESEPLTSIENNPPHCSTQDYNTGSDSVAEAYSTFNNSNQDNMNEDTANSIVQQCTVIDNDIQNTRNEDTANSIAQECTVIDKDTENENTVDSTAQECTTIDNDIQNTRNKNTPDTISQECITIDNDNQDTRNENSPNSIAQECATIDNDMQDSGSVDCIDFYKKHVLNRSRDPGIIYGPNANVDDLYVDVIIYTERAQHNFREEMKRHEIYDVYMEVPPDSIPLETIVELFYPNTDTKGKFPRTILAIGRPGIGKTVLTEKIFRDWANGIHKYYSDKIVFLFKFRWFNENLRNFSLKTFLRLGTGLSEEEFESINDEIVTEPQKAILIFDGLDEYHGDHISCLDQSRIIPNDPHSGMSVMNLFIKLVLGDLLKGATVVVTSRPTANDFYSRLDLARKVEIIGFTSDKIEEYVSRFCNNNNMSDHTARIWNHIISSSELLNLCYIPVNCFIVCVTLSGCLSDARNETGALPTTLTELYQTAIDHFEKHHHRNANRNFATHEALEQLQRLAFLGMESGQLVFNQTLFDEEMKASGLLNCLSNPIFPLQTHFCFIHLTIQEFLAARHVTETFDPLEIKKFISEHVERGKWHLVLQFIAGLLGKNIKNFDWKYKDCVFAFAESLKVTNGEIALDYPELFIMKCLRETGDEKIAKEVCEATAINDCIRLIFNGQDLYVYASEWTAVTFVCKHIKKLVTLSLVFFYEDCLEILRLLRRCVKELEMVLFDDPAIRFESVTVNWLAGVFSTLMDCPFDHKHSELTSLSLSLNRITEKNLEAMCNFFENGHGSQLEKFHLSAEIRSHHIPKLCAVLNNEHCPNLTHLDLRNNKLSDEGAKLLCDTLTKEFCKLNTLNVWSNNLTDECIPTLVKALQDERCQLTDLSLELNAIRDKGVCMLSEDALTNKHCKLTKLNLADCSLTNRCIPSFCFALQDERCQLTDLSLQWNSISDEGAVMLFEDALTNKHCKLTTLNLNHTSLTDQCIPSVCKALQDERCQLTDLSLQLNAISDEGAVMLLENALTNKHCKLTTLNLDHFLLDDQGQLIIY